MRRLLQILRRRLAKRRLARALIGSPLWDPVWYRSQAGVPADPQLDPMRHYLLIGAARGLRPNPLFDPVWYVRHVPGLALEDALDHYVRGGRAAWQSPHPLFDPAWYVRAVPQAAGDPLGHYLAHGAQTDGDPHTLFDTAWYRRAAPEAERRNPLLHYLERGAAAGLDPNPHFDGAWYLAQNADAARAGTPLEHYVAHPERDPSPVFDTAFYRRQPGVAGNPLADYLHRGRAAGLVPLPGFDPVFYARTNPGATDPLDHYRRVGRARRRPINAAEREQQARVQAAVLGVGVAPPPLRVCIGIVTYDNPPGQLRRAVASAQLAASRAGCALSVLMIDNGGPSSLAVSDMVLAPALPSAGNIGFGAAQNRLIARAFAGDADVFLALNPDSALHPGALRAMLQMHHAASGRALIEAIQCPEEYKKVHDPVDFETPWASGACLLLPRRIYETIGAFDERYFLYCEDVDLSWRARAAGFHVKTCTPALLFHMLGNRVPDQETHRRFLTSALALAVKWGGEAFADIVRETMRAHGVPVPAAEAAREEAAPGIADFAHGFMFAPGRW